MDSGNEAAINAKLKEIEELKENLAETKANIANPEFAGEKEGNEEIAKEIEAELKNAEQALQDLMDGQIKEKPVVTDADKQEAQQFTIKSVTVNKDEVKQPQPDSQAGKDDDDDDEDEDENYMPYGYDLGEEEEDAPVLITEPKYQKRVAATEPQFQFYRNLYYGEIENIPDCMLTQFTDKAWQPKCSVPINNSIFMQTVFDDMANHELELLSDTSCKVNKLVTVELMVGTAADVLSQPGTVVGLLRGKQPTEETQPFLPNFEADLKTHDELTGYSIEDGGVIPCSNKSTLPSAEKFLLVQVSAEPNLEAGVAAVLNILDAAELMTAQTVSIPALKSFFVDDNERAVQTIYQTIEFLHSIRDNKKLTTVRLFSDDEASRGLMASAMKSIINARK